MAQRVSEYEQQGATKYCRQVPARAQQQQVGRFRERQLDQAAPDRVKVRLCFEETFTEMYRCGCYPRTISCFQTAIPCTNFNVRVLATQTEYTAENAADPLELKWRKARVRTVELLLEIVVHKAHASQQFNQQVQYFSVHPSQAKDSWESVKLTSAESSNWCIKERVDSFRPVKDKRPYAEQHEEKSQNTEVDEQTVYENPVRFMPDSVIDISGYRRNLTRKIPRAKIHLVGSLDVAPINHIPVFESATKSCFDPAVDQHGNSLIRRAPKPTLHVGYQIDGTAPCSKKNNIVCDGEIDEKSCITLDLSEQHQLPCSQGQLPADPSHTLNKDQTFEMALNKAVQDCGVNEPFYLQRTPANENSPDKVVIIPQSLADKSNMTLHSLNDWTLRTPSRQESIETVQQTKEDCQLATHSLRAPSQYTQDQRSFQNMGSYSSFIDAKDSAYSCGLASNQQVSTRSSNYLSPTGQVATPVPKCAPIKRPRIYTGPTHSAPASAMAFTNVNNDTTRKAETNSFDRFLAVEDPRQAMRYSKSVKGAKAARGKPRVQVRRKPTIIQETCTPCSDTVAGDITSPVQPNLAAKKPSSGYNLRQQARRRSKSKDQTTGDLAFYNSMLCGGIGCKSTNDPACMPNNVAAIR